MFKNWKVWLGFGISIIALYFLLRDVPIRELGASLNQADWIWYLPAVPIWLISLVARAIRWSILMEGAPFWVSFHTTNIGYMLNMLLPARLGEVARVYVISERAKIPAAKALSSIVVERVLDLAVVVLMFVVFAQFLPMPPSLATGARLAGIAVTAMIIIGAIVVWQAPRFEALLGRLFARFLPKVDAAPWLIRFRDLCRGFAVIGTPKRFTQVMLYTVLLWGSALVYAWFTMRAFLPQAQFDQAGLFLVAANLGGAVPSAPGAVGVQEFAGVSVLSPFGLDITLIRAYALFWSFSQRIVLIILGLVGLRAMGVSLNSLTGSKPKPVVESGTSASAKA